MQFQAGYIIESVINSLKKNESFDSNKIDALLKSLSYFDVNSTLEIPELPIDPKSIFAVVDNLISRGLPTRLSHPLELKFHIVFGSFENVSKYGSIEYNYTDDNEETLQKIYKSLHIIDPRLSEEEIEENYIDCETLDQNSPKEHEFLFDYISKKFDKNLSNVFLQTIEPQRPFFSIIDEATRSKNQNLLRSRIDFVFEPLSDYSVEELNRGVVIEIDGRTHHERAAETQLDNQRDIAALSNGWDIIRIPTDQWHDIENHAVNLNTYSQHEYVEKLVECFRENLPSSMDGVKSLELVLSPFLIARIQKTLSQLFLREQLDFSKAELKIAVIERDVGGSAWAINDLEELYNNILELNDSELFKIPHFEVTVYTSSQFLDSPINSSEDISVVPIESIESDDTFYDVVLDVSILQRVGLSQTYYNKLSTKHYYEIRSCFSPRSSREFVTTDLIKYAPIAIRKSNDEFVEIADKKVILEKLLRDIFRKKEFRKGQIPILNRSLQLKSVIGLLPTGGGKSLTYQLSSLLQPGITIVIDPIKSLMQDQVDGLNRNLIDACNWINSYLSVEQRIKAIRNMREGKVLFSFVSPERLQIKEFREAILSMKEKGKYFSYCVIDEAHCVSEWGHDFRTSYLSLGKNAIKHCSTKNLSSIPLFGLTATASFDVLSDVQRELSDKSEDVLHEEAIIRFETYNRVELQYQIYEYDVDPNSLPRIAPNQLKINFLKDLKKNYGEKKQTELHKLINELPQKFLQMNSSIDSVSLYQGLNHNTLDDKLKLDLFENIQLSNLSTETFYSDKNKAGLIFAPHRSWVFGVTDKYNENNNQGLRGIFDNLPTNLGFKAQTFIGAKDGWTAAEDIDKDNIQNQIDKDNIQNQTDFIKNNLNLLVCTKAFGMGIDKPNIRYSIHFNYPQSIESFVQEAGRCGRDGKLALASILFNKRKYEIDEEEYDFDYNLLLDFHNQSFKGKLKEKTVIKELLEKIEISNLHQINIALQEQQENITLNLSHNHNLYINDEFRKEYAHFSLPAFKIIYGQTYTAQEADNKIELIREIITDRCPDIGNLISWLNKAFEPMPSIRHKLDSIKLGEKYELTLGFNNEYEKRVDPITNLLTQFVNPQVPGLRSFISYLLTHKTEKNTDFTKFKERIESFYQSKLGILIDLGNELNNEQFLKLQTLFYELRDKSDTEKAIYRLSTIGVIDDYTVDFRTKTFTIYGKKKSRDQYLDALREYVRRYHSELKTEEIVSSINQLEGDLIWNSLEYLIDFVYREIESRRRQAIDAMRDACLIGLEENGNEELKMFIDLYFNSKYARKNYEIELVEQGIFQNASLSDRTEEGKSQDLEWVWEFIEIVTDLDISNGLLDNLKHLRGATIRLLISNPQNATLLLLKSFSVFIIEEDRIDTSELIDEAVRDYVNGFESLFGDEKYDNIILFEATAKFWNYLSNNVTAENIDTIRKKMEFANSKIYLTAHIKWLKETNKKLGDVNGRRTAQTTS